MESALDVEGALKSSQELAVAAATAAARCSLLGNAKSAKASVKLALCNASENLVGKCPV